MSNPKYPGLRSRRNPQTAPSSPSLQFSQGNSEDNNNTPVRERKKRSAPSRGDSSSSHGIHPKREGSSNDQSRWVTDPKTGVRYKAMTPTPPDVLQSMKRAVKGAGFSISDMSMIPKEEEFEHIDAFNGNDLNKVAKVFLGHLKVPPNEEELKRLRQEYAERQRKSEQEYESIMQEISDKRGDDDTTYF